MEKPVMFLYLMLRHHTNSYDRFISCWSGWKNDKYLWVQDKQTYL